MPRTDNQSARFRPLCQLHDRIARTTAIPLSPILFPHGHAPFWIGRFLLHTFALQSIPLRLCHLGMNGHRSLPSHAAIDAGELMKLLLIAQEDQPQFPIAAIQPNREVCAHPIFIIKDHLFSTPGYALIRAALEHDVMIANVTRTVIAFLRDDQDITIRRLNNRGNAVVRFVVRREGKDRRGLQQRRASE